MQNILGIKVDTSSMTLEELKESRNKLLEKIANTKEKQSLYQLREVLMNVNHQIFMRKLLGNRYSS